MYHTPERSRASLEETAERTSGPSITSEGAPTDAALMSTASPRMLPRSRHRIFIVSSSGQAGPAVPILMRPTKELSGICDEPSMLRRGTSAVAADATMLTDLAPVRILQFAIASSVQVDKGKRVAIRAISAAMAIAALSSTAMAQQPDAFDACAPTQDPAVRLACFDHAVSARRATHRVAAAAPPIAPAPVARSAPAAAAAAAP